MTDRLRLESLAGINGIRIIGISVKIIAKVALKDPFLGNPKKATTYHLFSDLMMPGLQGEPSSFPIPQTRISRTKPP